MSGFRAHYRTDVLTVPSAADCHFFDAASPSCVRGAGARRDLRPERPVRRVSGVSDDGRSPAQAAIARLESAIAAVGEVDWQRESADSVRRASVVLQRAVNRVSAQALRPIEQLDARSAYRFDGAVTAASWLRNRTDMDPATAARLCTTARRLRGLPRLADAFKAGKVSYLHVAAITDAAIPQRFEAVSAMEQVLVDLARTDKPRAVRAAMRAIADVVDRDGVDALDDNLDLDPVPTPADERDPRRYWT